MVGINNLVWRKVCSLSIMCWSALYWCKFLKARSPPAAFWRKMQLQLIYLLHTFAPLLHLFFLTWLKHILCVYYTTVMPFALPIEKPLLLPCSWLTVALWEMNIVRSWNFFIVKCNGVAFLCARRQILSKQHLDKRKVHLSTFYFYAIDISHMPTGA